MLAKHIQNFIQQHSLISRNDKVAVAFSGGPDSASLLHILKQLYPQTEAIYVNHNLRTDSKKEEKFVRKFCTDNKIPLHIEEMNWKEKPANMEEAARKKRYRHLEKVAKEFGFTKIALAHHQDDLVETILLRLIRGTGPRGLIAMQPIRGRYIRPLLDSTRLEIQQYLVEQSLPSYNDPTNKNRNFDRNKIRHDLLPYIENNFNPKVRAALLRFANWSEEQSNLIDELIQPHLGLITDAGIHKNKFQQLSHPLQKELIRRALLKADPSFRINSRVLEAILKTITASTKMELPGYLMIECSQERIQFLQKTSGTGFQEIDVTGAGDYHFPPAKSSLKFSVVKKAELPALRHLAFVDADKAFFPLTIRNWKKGDSFQPLGMKGRKKLSDFWIDRKVPQSKRKNVPLVLKDDQIVWIAGHEIDDQFKVTSNTRKILKIELITNV
ncbi:MAG TPA: tRNA lysidine(34) synthetase TilS [Acidobacteriota bacterium]